MPARLGPRFAIEALFLILVAVAVGLADLQAKWIVVTMAGAWLLASAVELAASGMNRWPLVVRRARPWPGPEAAAEEEAVEPPEAFAEPPGEPAALDSWEQAAPPPAPLPEPEPEPAPPPEPEPPAPPEPAAEEAAEPEPEPEPAAPGVRSGETQVEERRTLHTLEPLEPRPRVSFWQRFRRKQEREEPPATEEPEE